jgi:Icc-related predicted phosphoesterase
MRITFISDSHNQHKKLRGDLPGGDLLLHGGDISSMGYQHEIREFCSWYNKQSLYDNKVFISGNHDFGFQNFPEKAREIIGEYDNIIYLQDESVNIDGVKIWGTPWQPWFYDWAFNLPRGGEELKAKWDMIPEDTDILITHGPPFGINDVVIGRYDNLGCELLTERLKIVKPKIHIFGHIHSGRNIFEQNGTLFINASVLDEQYRYNYKPITIDYDFNTKIWDIIDY